MKNYLEIDLSALENNIDVIQKHVGNSVTVAPVVKANAYGIGVDELIKSFENKNIQVVFVATVEEAINLRRAGYSKEIITLNELLPYEANKIVDFGITAGVSDENVANEINKCAKTENKIAKIHVEVDTGMGRIGIKPENMLNFIKRVNSLTNIEIEGIYTHFSSADCDAEYTKLQVEKFNNVLENLEKQGFNFKYIHASASSGILKVNIPKCNMVRPGIILYGYMPNKNMKNELGLKPITKLISHVVFEKEIQKGDSIGYSRSYIAPEKRRIATIPIGYADGIRRALSNKGRVYINGKFANIVGNICMDNFMIDVTDIEDVKVGDEVIIWDNEHITIEEIAEMCDTINYEILCGISDRVKRLKKGIDKNGLESTISI